VRTAVSRVSPSGVSFAATDTASFYAWGLVTPVTITINGCGGSNVLDLSASGNVTRD